MMGYLFAVSTLAIFKRRRLRFHQLSSPSLNGFLEVKLNLYITLTNPCIILRSRVIIRAASIRWLNRSSKHCASYLASDIVSAKWQAAAVSSALQHTRVRYSVCLRQAHAPLRKIPWLKGLLLINNSRLPYIFLLNQLRIRTLFVEYALFAASHSHRIVFVTEEQALRKCLLNQLYNYLRLVGIPATSFSKRSRLM